MGSDTGKRHARHTAIRNCIRSSEIKTQNDLIESLRKCGFDCTQSTVSRDIAELGLVKSRNGRYVLPEDQRLERMVSEMVESLKAAENIIVLKTLPGAAAGVCAVLDEAGLPGVLGSVAGDDTLFMVAESKEQAAVVADMILNRKKAASHA